MSNALASTADTEDRTVTIQEIGRGCYAVAVEGEPNTGVIVGDDCVMVVDAQATPALAEKVIDRIRTVTDMPIKYLVLTHYHAVRVLGASAYGASDIIASDLTKRMIEERGSADWKSQYARLPKQFPGAGAIPGLTRPTMSFASSMSISLGNRDVRIMHLGRGHTMGDVVVFVPDAEVTFAGDLVDYKAASYCGDAHLGDWPRALDRILAFRPKTLLPGRGPALVGPQKVLEGIELTRDFVTTLRDASLAAVQAGLGLKDTFLAVRDVMDPRFSDYALYEHCLPFNVARAYDEALGLDIPQIWTEERDRDLQDALKGVSAPAGRAVAEPIVVEEQFELGTPASNADDDDDVLELVEAEATGPDQGGDGYADGVVVEGSASADAVREKVVEPAE